MGVTQFSQKIFDIITPFFKSINTIIELFPCGNIFFNLQMNDFRE